MKKLNEIIPSTQFTPESKPEQDSTRPDKVWAQLGELFGKAFYREHGEDPPKLWRHAVSRLTDTQIANGLANLANDDLSFPANLSQFVAACKRITRAPYWSNKQLEAPADPEERALEERKAFEDMERLAGRKLR